jgi:hypothetical protein
VSETQSSPSVEERLAAFEQRLELALKTEQGQRMDQVVELQKQVNHPRTVIDDSSAVQLSPMAMFP